MTYAEAVAILENSSRQDWVCNTTANCYTYKNDLSFRIILEPTIERFSESWFTSVSELPAYKIKCNVYYNSSFVICVLLVKVDGGKARVPAPPAGKLKVEKLVYNVAMICNETGKCDKYMKKFGLSV